MQIRLAEPTDEDAVVAMWSALWPDASDEEHRTDVRAILAGAPPSTLPLVVLVAEDAGRLVGFAEVGLRSHADGCDTSRPCGFLEGWYVDPGHAGRGVGRALVEEAERWARGHGCTEMASDTWLDNPRSQQAHLALGFEEVDRCVNYRKSLAEPAPAGAAVDYYGPDLARLHHDHFGMVAAAAAGELLARLAGAGIDEGTVVDLAAGTGILSRRAVEAGYAATGVDISAGMLEIARSHAPDARFVLGSLWDVELPSCVAVTAVGEAFNYAAEDQAPDLERLERRLAAIHRALAPGGLLLFDVAGPGRSGPGGARKASWDRDGVLLYLDESEAGGRLTRTIDTFVPVGALYRRSREVHRLVLHSPDAVAAALERTGFRVERLAGYGEFRFPAGWTGFAAIR